MPYIKREDRLFLHEKKLGDEDEEFTPQEPGDLNYAITILIDNWLKDRGLSYTSINAAVGALECAKLELYRRVAVPFEDKKIIANGDVYSKENLSE